MEITPFQEIPKLLQRSRLELSLRRFCDDPQTKTALTKRAELEASLPAYTPTGARLCLKSHNPQIKDHIC